HAAVQRSDLPAQRRQHRDLPRRRHQPEAVPGALAVRLLRLDAAVDPLAVDHLHPALGGAVDSDHPVVPLDAELGMGDAQQRPLVLVRHRRALVAGQARTGAGLGDHRPHLEIPAVLDADHARRAHGDLERSVRGGADRRRDQVAAVLLRDLAADPEPLPHEHAALDHLEPRRLQQRVSAHRRRAERHHPRAGHARHPLRVPHVPAGHGRGHGHDRAPGVDPAGDPPGAASGTEDRGMKAVATQPHAAARQRPRQRSSLSYLVREAFAEGGLIVVGLVVLIWTLLPLYHMVMLSLTPVSDGFAGRFWPDNPTLENYRVVFTESHFFLQNFWIQLFNSIFVAVATMALVLVTASLASYAIGRLKMRYGHVI